MNHIGNPGYHEAWCGAADEHTYDTCSLDDNPGWCPTCCEALLFDGWPPTRKDELFKVGLDELCQGIVASMTGMSDPCDPKDFWEWVDYLRFRAMTWRPSNMEALAKYDQTMRDRILATLELVEHPQPVWTIFPRPESTETGTCAAPEPARSTP